MTNVKNNYVPYCLLCICVLLCGLISGCAVKVDNGIVYATSGYSAMLSLLLPEYEVHERSGVELDLLHSGAAIEAYDAQAIGAL